MLQGTIVIANDLLGFVEEVGDTFLQVKDKEGKLHKVNRSVCTEICNPAALALFGNSSSTGPMPTQTRLESAASCPC